ATVGSNQPCSATNPNGYNTGSSTANGLTPACTGAFAIAGSSSNAGPTAGLNSKGIIISEGGGGGTNSAGAGNLFSNTLIDAQTGAHLPSPTGAGALSNVPELVVFPGGFKPMEVLKEDDYQYDVGTKFNVLG